MKKCWVLILLLSAWVHAETPAVDAEAARLLERVARAARESAYQGIYVQQRGEVRETYRLFHAVVAGVEIERREALDGAPREMFRQGDVVSFFLPENLHRTVGTRAVTELMLPQMADSAIAQIVQRYQIKPSGHERVAGVEADVYLLQPRDKLRYAKKIWVHPATGLILKMALSGAGKRDVQDVFAFSQIQTGAFDPVLLRPESPFPPMNMQVRRGLPQAVREPGWDIGGLPAGYQLIRQARRILSGQSQPAIHHVYSDGLCSVSVFLEPTHEGMLQGAAHQGLTHVLGRDADGLHVTVLGDAPLETIESFSKAYRPIKDGKK